MMENQVFFELENKKYLEEFMKKIFCCFIIAIFLVGCAGIIFEDEISNFITDELAEDVVESLATSSWWLENDNLYTNHLTPWQELRVSIAQNYASEKGKSFGDVYEAVYKMLRKRYSNPDILWQDYLRLKPVIIREIQESPELIIKLNKVFDDEFLAHLAGKSSHADYLFQRWERMNELELLDQNHWVEVSEEDLLQIEKENEAISSEKHQSSGVMSFIGHDRWELANGRFYRSVSSTGEVESEQYVKHLCKFNVFQADHGYYHGVWGYAYEIPEKCGNAFDFYMRRKSEGGEKLAQTWARIAQDLMASI